MKKLSLNQVKTQAKDLRVFVEKKVEWVVTDENGESQKYDGLVDIISLGSMSFNAAQQFRDKFTNAKSTGEDEQGIIISTLVYFDGESLTPTDAVTLPDSLFSALVNAIVDVNPSLKAKEQKEDEAGKP